MFRTASRLPRRAFLSATVAGTAVGLHDSPQKLSIYPEPDPEILLVESPSKLEHEIGVVRRHVLRTYADAHAHVQSWVSHWIGVEHAVENRVKSILAPDEALTPGLLYTGIAGLTASVLARTRSRPTRALLPPLALALAAHHFLPKTTANLTAYLGSLEDTYLPTVAEKHEVGKAHAGMAWARVREAAAEGREKVERGAVEAVEGIQKATGLKLKETLGWQLATAAEGERAVGKAVAEAGAVGASKVEEAEKKVEEGKRVV
ncbi:apolipo protein O-domain-containing protein [Pholiota molesta]|nr:apolipo protein O-domain-containing protein [Pholiota molesta]